MNKIRFALLWKTLSAPVQS